MNPQDIRQEPWFRAQEYPFESQWFATPDGYQMHYLDEGQGPTVVLSHGTPTWSFEYRYLVAALRGQFRCIVPDHLGFGLSAKPPGADYTPTAHTARLKALLQHLGVHQYDLVIHDIGGAIALPLAIENPEHVGKLVVFNSFVWNFDSDAAFRYGRWLLASVFMRWLYLNTHYETRVMMKRVWGKHRPLTRELLQHYEALNPSKNERHAIYAVLRALLDGRQVLDPIGAQLTRLRGIPSRIIWGEADTLLGPRHLERWRQELPQAEVTTYKTVGHFVPDQAGPEVAPLVAAFLAETVG